MFATAIFVIFSQESKKRWLTISIQVEFGGAVSKSFAPYHGCYDIAPDVPNNNRYNYKLLSDNITAIKTQFGYCKDERKWFLYNSQLDDPCEAKGNKIAFLSRMNTFDISTSFDETWYSTSNEPIDLIINNPRERTKDCRSTLLTESVMSSSTFLHIIMMKVTAVPPHVIMLSVERVA